MTPGHDHSGESVNDIRKGKATYSLCDTLKPIDLIHGSLHKTETVLYEMQCFMNKQKVSNPVQRILQYSPTDYCILAM